MPQRPDDPYSSVPSVLPTTEAPNDYIRSQATPQDAGAQIGQATEKFGDTTEQVANQFTGMINESLATQAETDYMTKLSGIVGNYKSLEGYAAIQAHDKTIQDITDLRQQMMADLPTGGAQRAFATLALRHEAYGLSDVNGYAGQAAKQFDMQSAATSADAATQNAASYSVASDDARFTDQLHTVRFQTNRMMQNKGYGGLMTQNPDGTVSFDTSNPAGSDAKSVYDQITSKYEGQAWENRIHALAEDPSGGNVLNAQKVFETNKDSIPPEAQMKISAWLQPKVRTAATDGFAGTVLQDADKGYQGSLNGAPAASGQAKDITEALGMQESGGNSAAPASATGAAGKYQIEPDTFKGAALPGESFDSEADREAVSKRLIQKYNQDYNGDPARVAVAWYSGPGNVSPPDDPQPFVEDKAPRPGVAGPTTSQYVNQVLSRMPNGGVPADGSTPSQGATAAQPATAQAAPTTNYYSKADYYKENYDSIVENARAQASKQFNNDPVAMDQAVARVQQQLDSEIRHQTESYQADRDIIWRGINGNDKQAPPQTVQQLEAMDPDTQAAWGRVAAQQPEFAHQIMTNVLPVMAKGSTAKEYGPQFTDIYNRIIAPPSDPTRITDDSSFAGLLDKGLTLPGIEKLQGVLRGEGKPETASESRMESQFYKVAKQQLSFDDPTMMMKDPYGEQLYSSFLPLADAAISKAKAAGKPLGQIYDVQSPEIKGIIDSLKRNSAQHTADLAAANQAAIMGAPIPQEPGFFGRLIGEAATFDQPSREATIAAYKALKNPTPQDYAAAIAHWKSLPQPAALTPAATE